MPRNDDKCSLCGVSLSQYEEIICWECEAKPDKWNTPSPTKGPTTLTSFGTTYTYEKCKHDGTPKFAVGDIKFGGGSDGGAYIDYRPTLLVRLNANKWGYDPGGHKISVPKQFDWVKKYTPDYLQVLDIDWQDGSDPPFDITFFEELIANTKRGAIVFACQGGHGRTGTAMAAMLIAGTGISAEEAINTIKKEYCDKAIETQLQYDWLCDAAGLNEVIKCPPKFTPTITINDYTAMSHPNTNFYRKNNSGKKCGTCSAEPAGWCRLSSGPCVIDKSPPKKPTK